MIVNHLNVKRALVTGGAGFIGSHIVEKLLSLGVEVVCVDDFSAGKVENIEAFRSDPNFILARCDITNHRELTPLFDGVDVVFHNAASKKTVCLEDPSRDLAVNAEGTLNILDLSDRFGVMKVVHASTGSVYGEAIYYPQDEKHPTEPTSFYGISKLAAEKYCMLYSQQYGLDVTILRYFHVYGSRQDSSDAGGVVPIFLKQALEGGPITIFGDGSQQRSFTFIDDLVRINMLVAMSDATIGEINNCASGIVVTILQLAEKIKRIVG
jgi:UDP-glucose 4-epimerase